MSNDGRVGLGPTAPLRAHVRDGHLDGAAHVGRRAKILLGTAERLVRGRAVHGRLRRGLDDTCGLRFGIEVVA